MLGYQTEDRAPVFELAGQVDPPVVADLSGRIAGALAAGHELVVIDLLAVLGMSTQALSELCAALRGVSAAGSRLTIVGADARVRWVLQTCQIDGVELHATIEAAVAGRPAASRARSWPHWRGVLAIKRSGHGRRGARALE